ncbi:MAG: glutaredoxin [Paraglaciecola sp.]|jgi:glutaredoxin
MSFLIKLIRNILGLIIVMIDFLTRGGKLKRSTDQQEKVDSDLSTMSLYQFYACPFCIKTRRALHKLNLPMQTRNASVGSSYREELLSGGGAVKVPCLRIEKDGKTQWMYESSEIIGFLEQRFT